MSDLRPVDSKIIEILENTISGDIFSSLDEKYKMEPRGKFNNTAQFVAKPRNAKDVSEIIKSANSLEFGICLGENKIGYERNNSKIQNSVAKNIEIDINETALDERERKILCVLMGLLRVDKARQVSGRTNLL